ncbi:MAG: EF-hand domain-containing protein [Planctomycetota bacterium]
MTPEARPVAEEAARDAPAPLPYATEETTIWAYLRNKYDRDGDDLISAEEYDRGDEAFERLDRNEDGAITEADFAAANRMKVRVAQMTLTRYFQSDEDATDLHIEEVRESFRAHDADGDERLSPGEFEEAMQRGNEAGGGGNPDLPPGMEPYETLLELADEDDDGTIGLADLEAFFRSQDSNDDGVWQRRPPRRRPGAGAQEMSGVPEGEPAPDFTLEPPEGGERVTLSSFAGVRPVALVFGSYT